MAIFYQSYESPVGTLLLSSDGEVLTGLSFEPKDIESEVQLPIFDLAKTQLDEYFVGDRKVFEIPLYNKGTTFQQKVWEEVAEIPFGSSLSYKELSIKIGDLKAIRAVGTANGKNNLAIIIPCHRVIGSDKSLTGYAWGTDKKEWLLRHENHPDFMQNQLSMF